MSEFAILYDMYKRTMRILKCVRLSMEMNTMLDLATGNGFSIWQDMVAAWYPGTEEQRQYEWPQELPNADDRRLWAEKLQGITSANYCLRRLLSIWIREPHKSWKWRYKSERDNIFRKEGETWYEYAVVHSRLHRNSKNYTLSSLK